MRVLILTNKVGGGHNSTANALKKEFEKYDSVDCRIVDSFEYISPLLQKGVSNSYLVSTTVFPALYAGGYRYQEIMDEKETKDAGANIVNYFLTQKLLTYFEEEFYPDVVISTHIFFSSIYQPYDRKKSNTCYICRYNYRFYNTSALVQAFKYGLFCYSKRATHISSYQKRYKKRADIAIWDTNIRQI